MRIPALAILTSVTVLTATPARAQTYNPDYPVCLQVYDIEGSYIECGYTSLPQCAQSASGRAAQCIASSIHILPARKCARRDMIGVITASTRACTAHPEAEQERGEAVVQP